MRFALLLCLALLSLPYPTHALDILSVAPASASAGQSITLTGGPFPQGSIVRLGLFQVTPDLLENTHLSFTLPDLAEGDYSLVVTHGGKISAKAVTLRVVEPNPWITTVEPSSLDECSSPEERQISVRGHGFGAGASLQLDGATVPATLSGGEFLLTVPPLSPGLHEVRVLSAGGKRSEAHALSIASQPEIYGVSQGSDNVTVYEVIINGKNFLFSSVLVVDGRLVTTGSNRTQADHLSYQDCRTLIYHRYPYSREPKQVNLQVVNPGGNQSQLYQATIP